MASYHTIVREQAGIAIEKAQEDLLIEEISKQKTELSQTIKIQWLEDEVTKGFFRSISSQIDELEIKARQAACVYHLNNNHQEIINLLIRAEELRNIRQKYGRSNNS